MTRDDLIKAIHEQLEKLPEKQLQEVLDYINELAKRSNQENFVKEIINEDREVFTKLAQ